MLCVVCCVVCCVVLGVVLGVVRGCIRSGAVRRGGVWCCVVCCVVCLGASEAALCAAEECGAVNRDIAQDECSVLLCKTRILGSPYTSSRRGQLVLSSYLYAIRFNAPTTYAFGLSI